MQTNNRNRSASFDASEKLTTFIENNPNCVLTLQDAGNVDIDDQLAVLMLQKHGIPNIIVCGCDGKAPAVSKDLLQKFGIK